MGDIVKGVAAVAGAAGNLFGSKKKSSASSTSNEAYQDFQRRLGAEYEEDVIARELAGQGLIDSSEVSARQTAATERDAALINNLFRDALIRFSTGSLQPTPEQVAQSTAFVDETFTKPAEVQFGRFLDQAQTAQQERAAALGRQATDASYQREFAAQSSQVAQDLANQRAGLIAQRADQLAFERPQQQLSGLLQGSQFFNNSLNQAMANRLNLLNAATQQQQLGLNRQIQSGGYTMNQKGSGQAITPNDNVGIGTQLTGIGQAVGNLYETVRASQGSAFDSAPTAGSTPSLGNYSNFGPAFKPSIGFKFS